MNDIYFDDEDPEVFDPELPTEDNAENITSDTNDLLGDPLLMAVALGLGEEIGLEQERLADGEPISRVKGNIERIPIKATKTGSFFEYVLNRSKN